MIIKKTEKSTGLKKKKKNLDARLRFWLKNQKLKKKEKKMLTAVETLRSRGKSCTISKALVAATMFSTQIT